MKNLQNQTGQVLYNYKLCDEIYLNISKWLKKYNFILFLEDDEENFKKFYEDVRFRKILSSPFVKCILLKENLEESIKSLAWDHVFLDMHISSSKTASQESFLKIKALLEYYHLGVHLTASNYSDFGHLFFDNCYSNLFSSKKIKLFDAFAQKFKNVPAIIVAAGPSLDKNIHLLKNLPQNYLLLAGGAALKALFKENIVPSFKGAVDKEAKLDESFKDVPLFYLPQMFKQNLKIHQGEKILISNTENYPLEKWLFDNLNIFQKPFHGGWNVTNFLTKIATLLGCNPITFIGLDLCFKDRRYAKSINIKSEPKPLLETFDRFQNKVFTQKDWLMAKNWLEEFALENKDISFINATEGGLFIQNTQQKPLSEVINSFSSDLNISDMIAKIFQSIKDENVEQTQVAELFAKIEKSAINSLQICDDIMKTLEQTPDFASQVISFEKLHHEFFYTHLLNPLWEVWKHILKRELQLKNEFELSINKLIFLRNVITEHTDILKRAKY
ncbi:MAG: motility associated factor glycosyltransferase family protein [Chlamydiae bacterium]|nr:motility associated factor glycosyltransferase family protein [Chlamydiota bacterium]